MFCLPVIHKLKVYNEQKISILQEAAGAILNELNNACFWSLIVNNVLK